MSIIDKHIKELADMGCFTGEELTDLRERFVEVFESGYWDGYEHQGNKIIVEAYGKKEDW